jgi:hypothetical protein
VALMTIVYLPPSTKSERAGWIIVSSPIERKTYSFKPVSKQQNT